MEKFLDDLSIAITADPAHSAIVCGDFNAKVGVKTDVSENLLGSFGSPGRNDSGKTILNFLLGNKLFLMNSFFYKKFHCRWTWRTQMVE